MTKLALEPEEHLWLLREEFEHAQREVGIVEMASLMKPNASLTKHERERRGQSEAADQGSELGSRTTEEFGARRWHVIALC